MAELDKVAERQPFYLEAVSELLRLAGTRTGDGAQHRPGLSRRGFLYEWMFG